MTPRPLFLATLLLALAFPSAARALDAAQLAPADASVFVQIDDVTQWRQALPAGLFSRLVRPPAAGSGPRAGGGDPWAAIEAALGMSSEQILDRYFGQCVALVVQDRGGEPSAVLLSRVTPASAQIVIDRLTLRQLDDLGGFRSFTTTDGRGRLAFSDQWMLLASDQNAPLLEAIARRAGQDARLAGDEAFRQWTGRLSPQRSALAYLRRQNGAECHAISLARQGRDLVIKYAGTRPGLAGIIDQPAADPLNMGPAPLSAVAALSLSVLDRQPPPMPLLDRLLSPLTFQGDVLPKLDAPLVFFMGPAQAMLGRGPLGGEARPMGPPAMRPDPNGDATGPRGGNLTIPSLATAIRMKDPAVATALDRAIDGLILLANVKSMEWNAPPITTAARRVGESTYHTVDLGPILAERARRPELSRLRLAYGAVGPWYLITSNEPYFRQVAEAQQRPGGLLTGSPRIAAIQLPDVPRPVATAVMQGPDLARYVRAGLLVWRGTMMRAVEPPRRGDGPEPPRPSDPQRPRRPHDEPGNEPGDGPAASTRRPPGPMHGPGEMFRIARAAWMLAGVLEHYDNITLRLGRADSNAIVGEARLLARPENATPPADPDPAPAPAPPGP